MKTILIFIISLIITHQILGMVDYEAGFFLSTYGSTSTYSENKYQKDLKDKAKELLGERQESFQAQLVQHLGSLRKLERLDLSNQDQFSKSRKAQLLANYLNEEVSWNKEKKEINGCMLGCSTVPNAFISVVYLVPLIAVTTEMIFGDGPESKKRKCIWSVEDACFDRIPMNTSDSETNKLIQQCYEQAYSDPACQAMYEADKHASIFKGQVILYSGIAAFIFFQTLFQIIRIKFFKPNPDITAEKEELITRYTNTLNSKFDNATSLPTDAKAKDVASINEANSIIETIQEITPIMENV